MLGDPTVTMDEVASTLKVSRAAIYRAFQRDKATDELKALRTAARDAKKMMAAPSKNRKTVLEFEGEHIELTPGD